MDGVDGREVVVFDLAELEEAIQTVSSCLVMLSKGEAARHLLFAQLWRVVDQQINDDVANGGLQQDGHGGESQGISRKGLWL